MVTLDQIKELRNATGVSTMSCKHALEETHGDFQKAIEFLRKKGEAKSAARAGRSAGEGGFFFKQEGNTVALVGLKCETDFVARSDDFLKYGQELVDAEFIGQFDSVVSRLSDVAAKVGEKLQIGDRSVLEGAVVGAYVHTNRKIASVVVLSGGDSVMARDVAMHVAGIHPQCIFPEEVDDSILVSEREVWADQLKKEGKPEAMIPQIMKGKEKKFREEHALMTQPFVKNPDQTVAQFLGKEKVLKFVRLAI